MGKLTFTDEQFKKAEARATEYYREIKEIHCPYFGGKISFNRKGLDHIKFKRWNHARPRKDQYVRFKLFQYVPEVIRRSHTLQGVKKTETFERVKVNSRWEQKMLPVEYHEFIAVLKGSRLRIIIRRLNAGERHFWSLVPYWGQSEYGKEMFEGNPETD